MVLLINTSNKNQKFLSNLIPEIKYGDLVKEDLQAKYSNGKGFTESGAKRKQAVIDLSKTTTFENNSLKECLIRVKQNKKDIDISDSDDRKAEEKKLLNNFNIYQEQIKNFQKLALEFPEIEMIPFEVKLERNEDLYSVVYVEPDKPKLYKADGIDLSSITEPLQIPKISKQIKDFKVKHELSSEALSNFMKQLMNFIKRLKKDFNIEVENLDTLGTDNFRLIYDENSSKIKMLINSSAIKFESSTRKTNLRLNSKTFFNNLENIITTITQSRQY